MTSIDKNSKPPKKDQPDIADLTYEKALSELETIVASLEANKLALEETMSLYERGQLLIRHCVILLDEAQLRIKQLSGDELTDLNTEV